MELCPAQPCPGPAGTVRWNQAMGGWRPCLPSAAPRPRGNLNSSWLEYPEGREPTEHPTPTLLALGESREGPNGSVVWAGKGSTYLTLHPRLWLGARTGSINLWQGRWGVWLPSPAPCLEPQPPPELSFWKLLGNPVCGTPPPPQILGVLVWGACGETGAHSFPKCTFYLSSVWV